MFKRFALAAAGAAMVAVPVAAEAQGYYGGYAPSYGYSQPAYGYGYGQPAYGYPSYGYGNSYPAYGYNYGYGSQYRGYNGYGYNGYGYNSGRNVGAALVGGVIGLAIGSAITGNNHRYRSYRRHH